MSQDTIPAVTTYGGDVRDENGDGYFSGREYMHSVSNQGASWNHYGDVPADSDYVGQTPIASSYGMIQVLWTTAISQIKWSGYAGHRNPHLLFNSNIALDLGARYLRSQFVLSTASNWQLRWREALARYNGGSAPNYIYADAVLQLVYQYHPLKD